MFIKVYRKIICKCKYTYFDIFYFRYLFDISKFSKIEYKNIIKLKFVITTTIHDIYFSNAEKAHGIKNKYISSKENNNLK